MPARRARAFAIASDDRGAHTAKIRGECGADAAIALVR
jgi:hypothetical protein